MLVFDILCRNFFSQAFGCTADKVNMADIGLFACLLGNDFIDNIKKKGYAWSCTFMRTYVNAANQEVKDLLLLQLNHPTPKQLGHEQFFWQHAPAYCVCPINTSQSAREAFQAGTDSYRVELRSMTTNFISNNDVFYIPPMDKMNFLPHHNFMDCGKEGSHPEFFHLNRWSRTGRPLKNLPDQRNKQGEVFFPGSIIDFGTVPVKFVPSKSLEYWLSSRGVSCSTNREEVEVDVHNILSYGIDALPMCCLWGSGSYITWSVIDAKEETADVDTWKNDARFYY